MLKLRSDVDRERAVAAEHLHRVEEAAEGHEGLAARLLGELVEGHDRFDTAVFDALVAAGVVAPALSGETAALARQLADGLAEARSRRVRMVAEGGQPVLDPTHPDADDIRMRDEALDPADLGQDLVADLAAVAALQARQLHNLDEVLATQEALAQLRQDDFAAAQAGGRPAGIVRNYLETTTLELGLRQVVRDADADRDTVAAWLAAAEAAGPSAGTEVAAALPQLVAAAESNARLADALAEARQLQDAVQQRWAELGQFQARADQLAVAEYALQQAPADSARQAAVADLRAQVAADAARDTSPAGRSAAQARTRRSVYAVLAHQLDAVLDETRRLRAELPATDAGAGVFAQADPTVAAVQGELQDELERALDLQARLAAATREEEAPEQVAALRVRLLDATAALAAGRDDVEGRLLEASRVRGDDPAAVAELARTREVAEQHARLAELLAQGQALQQRFDQRFAASTAGMVPRADQEEVHRSLAELGAGRRALVEALAGARSQRESMLRSRLAFAPNAAAVDRRAQARVEAHRTLLDEIAAVESLTAGAPTPESLRELASRLESLERPLAEARVSREREQLAEEWGKYDAAAQALVERVRTGVDELGDDRGQLTRVLADALGLPELTDQRAPADARADAVRARLLAEIQSELDLQRTLEMDLTVSDELAPRSRPGEAEVHTASERLASLRGELTAALADAVDQAPDAPVVSPETAGAGVRPRIAQALFDLAANVRNLLALHREVDRERTAAARDTADRPAVHETGTEQVLRALSQSDDRLAATVTEALRSRPAPAPLEGTASAIGDFDGSIGRPHPRVVRGEIERQLDRLTGVAGAAEIESITRREPGLHHDPVSVDGVSRSTRYDDVSYLVQPRHGEPFVLTVSVGDMATAPGHGEPTDMARRSVDVDNRRVHITVSERAARRHVGRALAHDLAESLAALERVPDGLDTLLPGGPRASAPAALTPHDRGRLAEWAYLRDRAESSKPFTRSRAESDIAELLPAIGLDLLDPQALARARTWLAEATMADQHRPLLRELAESLEPSLDEGEEQDHARHDEIWTDPSWVAEGRRPGIGELIPRTAEEAIRWGREAKAAFLDQLTGVDLAGYGVSDDSAAADVQFDVQRDHVVVRLAFQHDSKGYGDAVMSFDRHDDGSLSIHISQIGLRFAEHHGSGMTGALLQLLENWGSESGVDFIELRAGHIAGRFVWAQHGFDWAPNSQHHALAFLKHLATERRAVDDDAVSLRAWLDGDDSVDVRALLQKHRSADPSALLTDLRRQSVEAGEILHRADTSAFNSTQFPTPYELSRAGWNGTRGPNATWVGKRAMLQHTWQAVKWIAPASGEAPRTRARSEWNRAELPASRFSREFVASPSVDPLGQVGPTYAEATVSAAELARRQEVATTAVEAARAAAAAGRADDGDVAWGAVEAFAGTVPSLPVQGRETGIDPADLKVLAEFAAVGLGDRTVTLESVPDSDAGTASYLARNGDGVPIGLVRTFDELAQLVREVSGLDRLGSEELTGFAVPEPRNVGVFRGPHGEMGALVTPLPVGRSLEQLAAEVSALSGPDQADARADAMATLRRAVSEVGAALAELHTRPAGSGRPLDQNLDWSRLADHRQELDAWLQRITRELDTVLGHQRVLRAAGLDYDRLLEAMDAAVHDARSREIGASLVHGNLRPPAVFWDGDHGVTFGGAGQVHSSIGADGAPAGWAGKDLLALRAALLSAALPLGAEDRQRLAEALHDAYTEAGGAPVVEDDPTGLAEMQAVGALTRELAETSDPVRHADLRQRLRGAVGALHVALALPEATPAELSLAERAAVQDLTRGLMRELRYAAETLRESVVVPSAALRLAADGAVALALDAAHASRAAAERAQAARPDPERTADAPAPDRMPQEAAVAPESRAAEILAREALILQQELAPVLSAVTQVAQDASEPDGNEADAEALATRAEALADMLAEAVLARGLETATLKAEIEALTSAEAPPRRPLVGELIPRSAEEADARRATVAAAFVERFENVDFAGYTVAASEETDSKHGVIDGRVIVRLTIRDAAGNLAGKADVVFHRRGQDTLVIERRDEELFDRQAHGSGFTAAFVQFLTTWAAESGVDRIEGSPANAAGGFVQAQYGLDWATHSEEETREILGDLERRADALEAHLAALTADESLDVADLLAEHQVADRDALVASLERQVEGARHVLRLAGQHAFGTMGFPTPYEVSRAGWDGVSRGPAATWIGKRAMLGRRWEGVQWIAPTPDAPATEKRPRPVRARLPLSRLAHMTPSVDPLAEAALAHGPETGTLQAQVDGLTAADRTVPVDGAGDQGARGFRRFFGSARDGDAAQRPDPDPAARAELERLSAEYFADVAARDQDVQRRWDDIAQRKGDARSAAAVESDTARLEDIAAHDMKDWRYQNTDAGQLVGQRDYAVRDSQVPGRRTPEFLHSRRAEAGARALPAAAVGSSADVGAGAARCVRRLSPPSRSPRRRLVLADQRVRTRFGRRPESELRHRPAELPADLSARHAQSRACRDPQRVLSRHHHLQRASPRSARRGVDRRSVADVGARRHGRTHQVRARSLRGGRVGGRARLRSDRAEAPPDGAGFRRADQFPPNLGSRPRMAGDSRGRLRRRGRRAGREALRAVVRRPVRIPGAHTPHTTPAASSRWTSCC